MTEKKFTEKEVKDMMKFDPDEFRISKSDIKIILDGIEQRWKSSKIDTIKNGHYIMGLEAIRTGLLFTKEEVISEIWGDIVKAFNALLEYNALIRMSGEMPKTSVLLDKVRSDIKSGKLFEKK